MANARLPSYTEAWMRIKEVHTVRAAVDWWLTWLMWVSSVIHGLRTIIGFAAAGIIVQSLINDYAKTGAPSTNTILLIASLIAIVGLMLILFKAYMDWRMDAFRIELDRFYEEKRMQTLLTLDLGRLWDPAFMKLRERLGWRGINAHEGIYSEALSIVASVAATIVSLGVLITLEPILIVLALIPVLPEIKARVWKNIRAEEIWEKHYRDRRLMRAFSNTLLDEREMVQSKLLRGHIHYWTRYKELLGIATLERRENEWIDLRIRVILQIIGAASYLAAMAYLGMRMTTGALNFAEIMIIAGSMQSASRALTSIGTDVTDLRIATEHYRHFDQYIDAKPSIDESQCGTLDVSAPPALELRNVSFSYPSHEGRKALDDCSFIVRPREHVAIVGRNGSGKTTAARMMTKVFLPEGDVFIDGVPLSEISQDSLLKHVVYSTQDADLPELSIRDVTTACTGTETDLQRFRRAASFIDMNETIDALPRGIDTMLDPTWDDGVDLSGGQRQRLRVIAAFYRLLDPLVHIGIFDEPMSHCDIETREKFYSGLTSLKDKTVIVIAHDPLYLHYFDRIIVMDRGRVIRELRDTESILGYRDELAKILTEDL